jgi:hypothetical protein
MAALLGLVSVGAIGWFAAMGLEPPKKPKKKASEDEDEDEDEEPENDPPKDPPPPPSDIDWSKRTVPENADDIPVRIKNAGYKVHTGDIIDQAGFSQWMWSATKPPCGGTVLLLVYGDAGVAAMSARVLRDQGRGQVLQTKNRVLFVQLVRHGGPTDNDPACTLPLLDALTR